MGTSFLVRPVSTNKQPWTGGGSRSARLPDEAEDTLSIKRSREQSLRGNSVPIQPSSQGRGREPAERPLRGWTRPGPRQVEAEALGADRG